MLKGHGPRETSGQYYEQNTRTLIGFGIYFYDSIKMKIKCIRVDIISDILTTNALSTNRSFRYLLKQEFFKNIDCKSLIIWADCGTHFRSAENSHFFLVELPLLGYSVEINYFSEKHGKNGCDQHFSVVSKFLEYDSYIKRVKMLSLFYLFV